MVRLFLISFYKEIYTPQLWVVLRLSGRPRVQADSPFHLRGMVNPPPSRGNRRGAPRDTHSDRPALLVSSLEGSVAHSLVNLGKREPGHDGGLFLLPPASRESRPRGS